MNTESTVLGPLVHNPLADPLSDGAIGEGVHLYALIKRSSKYRYQQRTKEHFAVHFGDYPNGGYMVFGNDNQYRIEDLRFYVRVGDRFVALT